MTNGEPPTAAGSGSGQWELYWHENGREFFPAKSAREIRDFGRKFRGKHKKGDSLNRRSRELVNPSSEVTSEKVRNGRMSDFSWNCIDRLK